MFKYLGQHIFDFVSKFRNDVYLENLTEVEQEFTIQVAADGKLTKSTAPGERSRIQVRNDEGSVIPAGSPLYSRGEVGGSNRIKVGICVSSDSAKMPCIGIAEFEMNTSDTKDSFAVTQGVYNTNISGFTGLSEGDILYVNGGVAPHLTPTKPTNGDLIQNVGVVLKTNGTICQGLLVAAIGRTNDVPWPLYVDVPNSQVAIGTTTPTANRNLTIQQSDDVNGGIELIRSNGIQKLRVHYGGLNNAGSFQQLGIIGDYGVGFLQNQNRSSGNIFEFGRISGRRITDTDAEQAFVKISPDIGQSGTANYVGLLMDVTETSVGSGTNSLMDLRVGGSSMFTVRNDGNVGIGTTSPQYILDAFGTDSSSAINTNVAFNISRVVKPDLTNTTATLATGTELPLANMYYSITYYNAIGETERGGFVSILPTSGNQRVQLNNLPISPDPSVIGRKIYRNKSTDGSSYGALIATIADNTTTSYLDSLPESDPVFSGHIFSRTIWALANTTTNFISVDDVRSMVVDPNLTVFGYNSGQSITRAASSTLIGSESGKNITYGSGNTLVGYRAGLAITTGPQNVLIGDNAGAQNLTTGGYNIALGPNTLKTNGDHNIAMGYYTGQALGSGNRNVLIGGYIAQGTSTNFSDSVIIGVNATNINGTNGQVNINNLIFGNKFTQQVGIGTTSPLQPLHVNGNIQQQGTTNSIYMIDGGEIRGTSNVTLRSLGTFIALQSSGSLFFQAADTERMRIDSTTGNVGIGTTSPSEKLHVGGNAKIQGNIYLNDATERYIYGYNNLSYIKFYDPSYGGIEIGSTANHKVKVVASELEVTGGFSTGGNFTMNGDLSIGNGNKVQSSSGNNYIHLYRGSDASMVFKITHPTVGHYIWLDKDDNELVRFTRDGNVGIGTTSPTEKLEVSGNIKTTGDITFDGGAGIINGLRTINRTGEIRINTTQGTRFGETALAVGGIVDIIGKYDKIPLGIKQQVGTTQNKLATFKDSSGTEVLAITTNGGFETLDSNLVKRFEFGHGYSPSPVDGMGIGLDLKTENASGVVVSVGSIDVIQDDVSADLSSMRLSVGETTPTEIMRLESGGNVGIGITSPTEKLEVSGNIKASGTIKGKMEQMFACSFSDDLGTTKHYLSFTSNAEQTNVHADQAAMVMPYNGRVKSIQLRLSNIDADTTRTFGIETIAPGINMYASSNNWTIEETEAYELAATDDFYLVNYVFSNTNHFESGDLLAISIQDTEDAYTASRQTYVNVIIEYDLNNGMGNDTATTKYTS